MGSVDSMKLTGITFTPVNAGTQTTTAVLVHTFNEGGGNAKGPFYWAMSQGGHYDPPSGQKMYNDRLTLTGTSTVGSLGVINVGPITSPDAINLIGTISKNNLAAKLINSACDTGGSRCAPRVTYSYAITSIDFDVLLLTDSLVGCGGTCDEGDGTNKLLPCAAFLPICEDQITAAGRADLNAGFAAGGVEVCDGDCIVTIVKATPSNKGAGLTVDFSATGHFDATGSGVTPFSITTNEDGIGYHTFKDLVTGPTVGA